MNIQVRQVKSDLDHRGLTDETAVSSAGLLNMMARLGMG